MSILEGGVRDVVPPQDPRLPPLPPGLYYGTPDQYEEFLGPQPKKQTSNFNKSIPLDKSRTTSSIPLMNVFGSMDGADLSLNVPLHGENREFSNTMPQSLEGGGKKRLGAKRMWLSNLAAAKVVPPSALMKDGNYIEAGRRRLQEYAASRAKDIGWRAFVGNVRNRSNQCLFSTSKYHREEDLAKHEGGAVLMDKAPYVDKEGAPLIKLGLTTMRSRSSAVGRTGAGLDDKYLDLKYTKALSWVPCSYTPQCMTFRQSPGSDILPMKLGYPNVTTGLFDHNVKGIGGNYGQNPFDQFEPAKETIAKHPKAFDATGRTTGIRDICDVNGKKLHAEYISAPSSNTDFVRIVTSMETGIGQGFRPCPRKNFKSSQIENVWK